MKFITVREFRSQASEIRKELRRERDIVLTANGRPFAILSSVGPDNVEEQLLALRRARARVALDRIRAKAQTDGANKLSLKDIAALVSEVRDEKRSSARE